MKVFLKFGMSETLVNSSLYMYSKTKLNVAPSRNFVAVLYCH